MATLSERIAVLMQEADELHGEVRALLKELDEGAEWDGIEAIEHLSDVPGGVETAVYLASSLYDALEAAERDAKKGGQ